MFRISKKGLSVLLVLLFALSILLSACKEKEPVKEQTASEVTQTNVSTTPEELKSMLDAKQEMVLVDVRSFNDYGMGHIPGAINIPLNSLEMLSKEQLPDKDAPISVYCSTQDCSHEAVELLSGAGYTQVYNAGSYQDWPYDTTAPISC